MAPATESIMGSLPVEKAGIGSAMNDTTRQVGGALGVAVLGSVFSASYTARLVPALHGLPDTVVRVAKQSVGAAIAVSQRLPGGAGRLLQLAARSSFVQAMDRAYLVGAGFAVLGALVALLWLPNRAAPGPATPEDTEEPLREASQVGAR